MPSNEVTAEASVWIDAAVEAVWARVANIASLGRYSPETTRTEWLPGSTGHEVGARFRGYNANERHQWHTDCTIVGYVEPTEFAFGVAPDELGQFVTIWTYRLSPERGGTRLTESFESPILADRPAEMSPTRRQTLAEMLQQTLTAIRADIESS